MTTSIHGLMQSLPDIDQLRACDAVYALQDAQTEIAIATFRFTRQRIMQWLVDQDEETIGEVYSSTLIDYVHLFITSHFCHHPPDDQEQTVLDAIHAEISSQDPLSVHALVMAMLLCPAFKLPAIALDRVPAWFLQEFMFYITQNFKFLPHESDLDQLCQHFITSMDLLLAYQAPNLGHIYYQFLLYNSFINIFADDKYTNAISARRAQIIERLICYNDLALGMPVPLLDERDKFHIGILAENFCASAEGYFALSHWHDLPRDRLRLTLFSTHQQKIGLEHYASQRADDFICLDLRQNTANLAQALMIIRQARLDALLISTNVCSVLNNSSLLAACRLAGIQIITSATPVSTHFHSADGYISATYNTAPTAQTDHTEKLLLLPESVNYYAYHLDYQPPQLALGRENLGLPHDKKLVFAGGNFIKLTPPLIRIWARIAAQCPDIHFVIMPYSPGWLAGVMPEGLLSQMCRRIFAETGVTDVPLTLIPTVPTRADRHQIMALCDLYIDSFPFSGACSMLDPLLAGLPIVARSVPHFRGLLSTAMLRACGLEDMASDDDDAYVARAVRLICDDGYRTHEARRVQAVRDAGLPFFDTVTYGRHLGDLLLKTLANRQQQDLALLASAADVLQDRLMALVRVLRHPLNPFFASLHTNHLRQTLIAGYFAHRPHQMPGYMLDIGAQNGAMTRLMLAQGWHADIIEPGSEHATALYELCTEFKGQACHHTHTGMATHSLKHRQKIDFLHIATATDIDLAHILTTYQPELILVTSPINLSRLADHGYGCLGFHTDLDPRTGRPILTNITHQSDTHSHHGDMILYRTDNSRFLACLLRQLAAMLHAKDRPDWA